MRAKRIYEVEVGTCGIGHSTMCDDYRGAIQLFGINKRLYNDVTLKSYKSDYTDERILKEFHRN